MTWLHVESSMVDAVATEGPDLLVRWTRPSGSIGVYVGAASLLPALLASPSVGAFLNDRVKPHYAYKRGPA